MKHLLKKPQTGCFLAMFVVSVLAFAGWLTHVIHTITNQEWLMLIAGAILVPIGIIHGWGIWLGLW